MKTLKYVAYLLKPIPNNCATKSKVASQDKLRERHNLQVMFGGILQSQDAYIIIPLRLTTIFFVFAMANLHQDLPRHLHYA